MSEELLSDRLATRFAQEFGAGLAAAAGANAIVEPATVNAEGRGLLLSVKLSGAHIGVLVAWVEASVAEAAARAATSAEAEPEFEEVLNLVREMATHASAIVALIPEFAGIRFTVSAITPGTAPVAAHLFQFPMPGDVHGMIGVSANLATGGDSSASRSNGNLDLVLDVELPLVVRFGRTTLSLKSLSGLGPGSIVDMARSPDDPVELLVSDKVIAYGEVVIVDGSYGLRITDLVSRSDRLRAWESR